MMFINPDKLNSRLEKGGTNFPEPISKTDLNRSGNKTGIGPKEWKRDGNPLGRKDSTNIPIEVRATIGAIGKISGIVNTAQAFSVTPAVVQDAKFGAITGHKESNPELVNKIEDILTPVRDKALDRLMKTFECLSDEKLQVCSAAILSKVAANLSSVLKNTVVENAANNNNLNSQVVIYTPSQRSPETYETIEVA